MKIRNKLTGEIREVADTELSNYGLQQPSMPSIPQPSLPSPVEVQPEDEQTKFQKMIRSAPDKKSADAIAESFKRDFGYGIFEDKPKPTPLTEPQQAKEDVKKLGVDALNALNNKDIKTGMIGGPLEQFKSKFSMGDQDTLDFNAKIGQMKAAIAKARAGTSFTPNEEKLLNSYTPVVGDSKQQLETKLKGLVSFYGGIVPEGIDKPKDKKNTADTLGDIPIVGPILSTVVGATTGSSINKNLPKVEKTLGSIQEESRNLINQAKNELDPVKKKELLDKSRALDQAGDKISTEFSGVVNDLTPEFATNKQSPNSKVDKLKAYGPQSIKTGVAVGEVIGTAQLVNTLYNATKSLTGQSAKKVISGMINKKQLLGDARKVAAKAVDVPIDTSDLVSAGRNYVVDDPMSQKIASKVLTQLEGKSLSVEELLRKQMVWNKAYTSAGRVGNSSKAGLYNALEQQAKKIMLEKAPEVAKYTELLAKQYGWDKAMKMVFSRVGGAAAGIGTGIVLGNILGKSR